MDNTKIANITTKHTYYILPITHILDTYNTYNTHYINRR